MGSKISTPTRRAMIVTGTYTGDGNDNRNINIGVNLATKSNVFVLVKATSTTCFYGRTEYSQGDVTMSFIGEVDFVNLIQSFTSTGFQVGTDQRGNHSGVVIRYIVFWQEG